MKGPYALRASRLSSELEEDQELLCLGGDLLVGDRRGDLLLGDRRSWFGDLTLTKRVGDLDLDRRGLLPLLLSDGEGALQRGFNFLFDRLRSAMRRFCSSVIDVCR